jgi:phage-related protein
MAGQTLTEVAVEVHADLTKLKPEVIRGSRDAGEKGGEELGDGITRGADGKLRDARGKFVASGQSSAKAFGGGFNKGFDSTFAKTAAMMASRFALMGGAAAAAAPGVGQLVSALVPAAGAALALPAALLAIKVASGVVKIAVMGVGDAISAGLTGTAKEADKALDQLSGNAREAAKQVISLKSPLMDIKNTISDRFFLPLLNDIKPLAEKYMPMLKSEAGDLAGPLGGLGEQIAKTAKRGLIFDTVRKVFEQTRLSVINIRGAIDPLAWSLALLVKDTVGELPGMAMGFAQASERFADFVAHASETGKITQAFRNGVKTLKDFGAVIGNVGSIVKSVYTAATANGNTLLTNLRELTGEAAAFFRSAEGSAGLQAVFGTLGSLGAALKSSLGSALPAISTSLQLVAPALVGLAQPAADLVKAIAPLLPFAAGLTAQLVKFLTPAIATLSTFLSQNEGVMKGLVIAIVAYTAAQRVAAAVTAVTAAGSIAKWITQTTIATNLTKLWTTLQYAFGVAMRFALGPIGLIIAAVGLLVAGIVYAYKNHEGFRNLVQKVWAGIQVAVKAVVDWFVNTALPWLKKVWEGIAQGAVQMWENYIKPALSAIVGFFRDVVAPAAMWLWQNVLLPAFKGISAAVQLNLAIVRTAAAGIVAFFRNVLAPAAMWLWKNVLQPAWKGISAAVQLNIAIVKAAITPLINFFRNVVGPAIMWLWKNVVVPAFNGWRATISAAWNFIRPIFEAIGKFVAERLVQNFRNGVKAISTAWDKLREASRVPIAFVVNKVINPLIGGFNKVAGVFGTPAIDTIKGFQEGGKIPGNSGGIDDRFAQMVGKGGKLLGSIKVAAGEFIVNAKDTAKALPLLRWINGGMKGGPMAAAARIGRPPAERPGDGSEGWAFKDGGLVGFMKDIWGAVSDPKKAILKPVEAALGSIPGGGMIRSLLVSMGKKLANGFVGWLGGAGMGDGGGAQGGNLGKAMSFVRAQNGKPYVWASAGPGGYDCSGIVSAAWNILHGRSPYQHTFSTGSLPGSYFPKSGPGGLLTAGWSHPGQRGASSGTGHMAGQFIGGMSFESTGSRGVHIGTGRKPRDFAHQGHFAGGGLLPGLAKIARADFGSVTLARGMNLIENATGRPEPLVTPNGAAGRLHPDDISALATAIGQVVGASLMGQIPQARTAARAAGRRPR